MPIPILDPYYLTLTLLLTLSIHLLAFLTSYTLRTDRLTDLTGSLTLLLLSLLPTLLSHLRPPTPLPVRNALTLALAALWALRLGIWQSFRLAKRGSDSRFDAFRGHFWTLGAFWAGQVLWVWTIAIPVVVLNSPAVVGGEQPGFGRPLDVIGVVVFVIGWTCEAWADWSKYRWTQTAPEAKSRPCSAFLWTLSRHPNYFGEMLVWWGIYFLTLSPAISGSLPPTARAALFGGAVSPLFTIFLLMCLSGLPTSERPTAQKFHRLSRTGYPDAWATYVEYKARTSPVVPVPQGVWVRLPGWVRWVMGEWGWWVWEPTEEEGEGEGR